MFWGFMLVCCLLIPVSMLVIGGLWRTRPPERVNGVYGYRTARSMKNRETWVFAHAYCGGLWRKMGWVLLVISAVALLPVWGKGPETIGAAGIGITAVQCAAAVLSVVPVEAALKRTFHENGRRRDPAGEEGDHA